jgi:ATP-dependent RNA helicase DDX56/DBP9
MKRKLNENDVPTSGAAAEAEKQQAETATTTTTTTTTAADEEATFADLGLDARLVQAVAEQGFLKPTLVQRRAIPLALDGKDVLCKAKTGSGKTAAYVLPVLAGILKKKSVRGRISLQMLKRVANFWLL